MNNRLILLRKNLSLTQAQLAAALKISRPYLTEIEKGTRKPSPDFFLALLLTTNVSLDWLFSGEGNMFRTSAPPSDPLLSDLISVFKQLSDDLKKEVLKYAIDQKDLAELRKTLKKDGWIAEKGGLDS